MKIEEKQFRARIARQLVTDALKLIRGCYLDEVGSGQLWQASERLDEAASHCRAVSRAIAEEHRKARL